MIWKIIVCVAVLYGLADTAPATTSSIGPKECADGPEYWCQDLIKAKSCGAVKHCIQTVWEHQTLPVDDSDICDTCKKMVKEARDQLLSNETQEEIREVFEGTCHIYFPIKILANECVKFVDELVPELIEMLASRMDPQLVCSTAGLCDTGRILELLSPVQPVSRLPTAGDCKDCMDFVKKGEEFITNHSKAEVQEMLLELCSSLGKYSAQCRVIVTEQFDRIYEFLTEKVNPKDFCALIGMCNELNNIPPVTSIIEIFIKSHVFKEDPECDFCEKLVQHIKDMITTNSTEEEVKELLLGFCNHCPYADKCKEFINNNFQEIYDFLTDELDPHLVCSVLGLCAGSEVASKKELAIPWTMLRPASIVNADIVATPDVYPQLESNDVDSAPFAPAKISKLEAAKKVLLKLPISKIDQKLIGAEEVMKKTAEDMQLPAARLMPSIMLGQAENIQLPASRLMPSIMLGQALAEAMQKKIEQPSSGPSCALCEYALHEIQILLMDNKTEESIKAAVAKVCNVLPKTVQDECRSFIDEYGDAILAMLAQQIDPSVVCVKLRLCGNRESMFVQTKFPQSKTDLLNPSDMQLPLGRMMTQILTDPQLLQRVPIRQLNMGSCDVCQMVIDYLDKLLEEKDVDDELTKVLERVCKIVPKSARPQCMTIIDTYGPYILQLLAQMADSGEVCKAIDLCPRTAGTVELLGGKKCTYGPSYWCKSVAHAKACKAEEHCKQTVWINN